MSVPAPLRIVDATSPPTPPHPTPNRPPTLPCEIYVEIVDRLHPSEFLSEIECKRILCRLALVSHLFYFIVVPRIFESLHCIGGGHLLDQTIIPNTRWLGIQRSEFLSPYVKFLVLSHWAELRLSCIQELPQFGNLHTFSITRTPVNALLFQALMSLPHLSSLTIKDCHFESLDPTVSLPPSAPGLTKFSMTGTPIEIARPYIPVVARFIQPGALRTIETNLWEFAEIVVDPRESWPSLEQVSLPYKVACAEAFVAFLSRTPSVTDLSIPLVIYPWGREVPPRLDLAPSALPHLHSIQCPLFLLCDLMTPLRPIKKVNISGTVLDDDDRAYLCDTDDVAFCPREVVLEALKQQGGEGGGRVEWLRVSTSVMHDLPVQEWLGALETLVVYSEFETMRCGVAHTCKMCPQSLPVREFRFEMKEKGRSELNWDLCRQRQTVEQKLSKAFPHATRIRCTADDSVEWRRDDDASSSSSPNKSGQSKRTAGIGTWTPMVLERDMMKTYLRKKAGDWEFWRDMINDDHGGCLRALFGEGEMTGGLERLLDPRFHCCWDEEGDW